MEWFSCYSWRKGFWFRLFGKGVCVSKGPLLFSERNGYTKVYRLFGFKIKLLRGA